MVVEVGRDGGVRNLEVHGFATLRISDEKFGRIRVCLENKDQRGIQLQVCCDFIALVKIDEINRSRFCG